MSKKDINPSIFVNTELYARIREIISHLNTDEVVEELYQLFSEKNVEERLVELPQSYDENGKMIINRTHIHKYNPHGEE